MDIKHYSVMRREVVELLLPVAGDGLVVDATVGGGGHAELFLAGNSRLRLVGVDADSDMLAIAGDRLADYRHRTRFFCDYNDQFFARYPLGDERPAIIFFDLGLSLFHLKQFKRGFSFAGERQPLDMRLDGGAGGGMSALRLIRSSSQQQLADLIYQYGEERYSRSIARAICESRRQIHNNIDLATVIRSAVPAVYRHGTINPATRTFQALRIAVNNELERLERALTASWQLLDTGGRLAVLSFHSLEDRVVKHFIKDIMKSYQFSEKKPTSRERKKKQLPFHSKKPLRPTAEEVAENPLSRSARLRVVEKLAACYV